MRINNILPSWLFRFGSVILKMRVVNLQSKHFLTGILLAFPNCEVIDHTLISVRQQLLERGAFPGTLLAHINPGHYWKLFSKHETWWIQSQGHGLLAEVKAGDEWFPLSCLLCSIWISSSQWESRQTVHYICLMEREINTVERYVLLPNLWEHFIFN